MERPGTKTEARRDDAGSASESRPRTVWERTGGLVSSLPSLVFVVVNSFTGLAPGKDRTGWLAFTKIAMGNPLTGLAFGAAAWAIHYASKREKLLADA
ncbi:hypothetical protein [Amycolatopsis sp. NPDC051372]|uniref:hypothetical protein n=1 Tax=unclassified Amycolatopsis TaxID=2618356 RepID=UPI00343C242F